MPKRKLPPLKGLGKKYKFPRSLGEDRRRETGDRRRETGDSIQETGDRRLFLFILPPQRARSDPPTPYTPHPTP
ncbi:MAG: hypothetical protein EWV48_14545 [Microcystis aeruginosa Ma_QC_C_20070823_S13]|nr:MAG: hypothetical protein EWV56_12590 [Microcystis aeruginosa Ma_QC_C_20070823_S13D]TRU59611.1 MAG: hypothetical protein EWV48_14545 [Microcystis aeruginosa Ma_QC_C_20070823_S13]